VWDLFPLDTVPRDGSHDAFVTAMTILRDEDGAEKQFDTWATATCAFCTRRCSPTSNCGTIMRPYAWLTKLYMLYRKKFYPSRASKHRGNRRGCGAHARADPRAHRRGRVLETEFPTYVLDEHFLTKLKDKKPDAKALDIEAMLSSELRIRLDQDESPSACCPRSCSG
jgi:type I restriction enzyme R subunit